jgi:hypothetical protein
VHSLRSKLSAGAGRKAPEAKAPEVIEGNLVIDGNLWVKGDQAIGGSTAVPSAPSGGALAAGSLSGDGSALEALDASQLTSGTLPGSALSGTYAAKLALTNEEDSFAGNGSGFTKLNADNLTSGTIPDERLSGTYSQPLTFSDAGNVFDGEGAGLTSLNASELSSGTLPSERLSGTYSNQLDFSNTGNELAGDGAGVTKVNAECVNKQQVVGGVYESNAAGIVNVAFPVLDFVGETTFIALYTASFEFLGATHTVNSIDFTGLTPNTEYIVLAVGDCKKS